MTAPRRSRTRRGAARLAPVSRHGGAFHFLSEIPVAGRHHDGARPFFLSCAARPPFHSWTVSPPGTAQGTTPAGAVPGGQAGAPAGLSACSEISGKSPAPGTAPSTPEVADTVPPQGTRVAGRGAATPSRKRAGARAEADPGTRGSPSRAGSRWTGVAGRQAAGTEPNGPLAQGRPPPYRRRGPGTTRGVPRPSYQLPRYLRSRSPRASERSHATRQGSRRDQKIAPSRRAPRRPRAACPR